MAAQNRSAALESDVMGKGAEAPALPTRRRTPGSLTGRGPAPSAAPVAPALPPQPTALAPEPAALAPEPIVLAPEVPAPVPAAAPAPTAGDVFYDKGTATADNFRPSYWTYERSATGDAAQPAPVAAAAPAAALPQEAITEEPPAVIGMPIAPEAELSQELVAAEPPAVVGVPADPEEEPAASHQPAAADELAATIEHVLGSRYASGRQAQNSTPAPRAIVGSAVTADSLLAELALARQSRAEESGSTSRRATRSSDPSRAPKKPTSLVDRAFAFGGLALIVFALLALSPWRDALSPTISRFFG